MTMKKTFFYLFLIALMPVAANAQEDIQMDEEGSFTIGISGGIDNNINAYKLDANSHGNEFSGEKPQYNIALDFGYMVNEKFRPRLELKRVAMSYSADWDKTLSSSLRKETNVDLKNFNINFHLDYLLLNKKKVQLFVSPGLKWEFNYKREVENVNIDGKTNDNEYNGIISENPKNIVGGAVSAILKYKFTEHIGITLTPEYTMFFRKYVTTNDKPYQRLSANFGLEFKF
jgi:hypothetical protein